RGTGESAHVHFVDDRLGRRRFERCVSLPIISTRICHDALHRRRGIVAFLLGSLAIVILWNHRAASIRIEENFGGIETHSTPGIESSVNAITIDLPRFHAGYENGPVGICPVSCGMERGRTLWPGVSNTSK